LTLVYLSLLLTYIINFQNNAINCTPLCAIVLTHSHKKQLCQRLNLGGFFAVEYYSFWLFICSELLTSNEITHQVERKKVKVECIREVSRVFANCTEWVHHQDLYTGFRIHAWMCEYITIFQLISKKKKKFGSMPQNNKKKVKSTASGVQLLRWVYHC